MDTRTGIYVCLVQGALSLTRLKGIQALKNIKCDSVFPDIYVDVLTASMLVPGSIKGDLMLSLCKPDPGIITTTKCERKRKEHDQSYMARLDSAG